MNKYELLLRPNETVSDMQVASHGSQEWAYGYVYSEIRNSTHEAGNSVVLDVEPQGSTEPVLIESDITLSVRALDGKGLAVVHNINNKHVVKVVKLDSSAKPLLLTKGDAYYYLNSGDTDLILRDDCTPAFSPVDEVQLTATPQDGQDGRAIKLPVIFWRGFEFTK